MNYNKILNIPNSSMLNKKLTKAFFLKNFDLTAKEKKFLNTNIEAMEILAEISNKSSNIPEWKDDNVAYCRIYIITCTLAENKLTKDAQKCIDLIQAYIPFHILLFVQDDKEFIINACTKRINKSDTNKRILEKSFTSGEINKLFKNSIVSNLFASMNYGCLDKTNLKTTFNSLLESIVKYKAACITGSFDKQKHTRYENDIEFINTIETLDLDIKGLILQMKKETQISDKVDLNIAIQEKRQQIEKAKESRMALMMNE